MNKFFTLGLLAVLPVTACSQTPAKTEFKTKADSISYSIGQDIGKNFRTNEFDINPAILAEGFREAYQGEESRLTDEEMGTILQEFQMAIRNKQMQRMQEESNKASAENEKYLTEKAAEPGFLKTASGLLYKIVREGSGPRPGATSNVRVHYKGTLTNGNVFDSSYDRGEPAEFVLNQVVRGWTEGLQLVKEGGKILLVIPPDLGYGPRGQGPIPPNAILVFEVEILKVL